MANSKYTPETIDYEDLNRNIRLNLPLYTLVHPFHTLKRKELFNAALQDILTRKITGINDKGELTYEGEVIDTSKNPMYGLATAYIIDLLYSTKLKPVEEPAPKLKFNSDFIINGINTLVTNDYFGGTTWDRKTDLRRFDGERDPQTGLYSTTHRKELLKNTLIKYRDSLTGDYDFTDSPYTDLNSFKEKINAAITALDGDNNEQIWRTLRAIGLDSEDWLSNGANDLVELPDGTKMTASLYYPKAYASQQAGTKPETPVETPKAPLQLLTASELRAFTKSKLDFTKIRKIKDNLYEDIDTKRRYQIKRKINQDSAFIQRFKQAYPDVTVVDLEKDKKNPGHYLVVGNDGKRYSHADIDYRLYMSKHSRRLNPAIETFTNKHIIPRMVKKATNNPFIALSLPWTLTTGFKGLYNIPNGLYNIYDWVFPEYTKGGEQ